MTKRRCSATTAAGKPCRAWAVRGTKPPLCSAHDGRNKGAGAPAGNTNNLKHGFYRSVLTPEEVADLISHAENETLDDELALVRVMLRRLMEFLQTEIPETPPNADEMVMKFAHYLDKATRLEAVAPLVFRGARTVAYLMRHQEPGETLRTIMDEVLDELGAAFEADL